MRLPLAEKAFLRTNNLLTSNVELNITKRILKIHMKGLASCKSESWTLGIPKKETLCRLKCRAVRIGGKDFQRRSVTT